MGLEEYNHFSTYRQDSFEQLNEAIYDGNPLTGKLSGRSRAISQNRSWTILQKMTYHRCTCQWNHLYDEWRGKY
jgi:hypothetical protein